MTNREHLRQLLLQLDGRGYKAYKEIKGSYTFTNFSLIIDRVQGDPFASPSQLRVQVPQSIADFPPNLYQTYSREIALRDYLTRQFDKEARDVSSRRGTGKSGLIAIVQVGQAILDRTSAFVSDEIVEVRFVVGLPARGRNILGRQAVEMLCEDIPEIVDKALKYSSLDKKKIQQQVETLEDADWLRQQLPQQGLVAFIPDGAILPRRSGVDERPMLTDAVPFKSPATLQVEFTCPNRGLVTGMGIPTGVTLIVGGGYHGKSTLLKAIELGVYNHIPEDGRELVVTHPAAMKIRAEDGRSIAGVDISPFINQLPQDRSTRQFSTTNASGSTSQAANIMEALEAGAQLLLVDEDTAATNFMIRDRRMQQLIAKDKEPITPFIDKVRQLYTDYGVSTILVMGGSGDYFDVADTVIAHGKLPTPGCHRKSKSDRTTTQHRTYPGRR
jgi:predicted ABC-class ATPase